jgi:hypothetical protein
MMETAYHTWQEANQHYLMAAIAAVQAELELFAYRLQANDFTEDNEAIKKLMDSGQLVEKAALTLTAPAALETLVKAFGLSSFEKKFLLMCAGVELKSDFSDLIASLQGNPSQPLPTFALAMAAFSDAHWSALSPERPMRFWRLVELREQATLTGSPVKIDEQMLHFLAGVSYMDERLSVITEPVHPGKWMAPSQEQLACRLFRNFEKTLPVSQHGPVVLLQGDHEDKAGIAAYVSSRLGKLLFKISAYTVPVVKNEFNGFIRNWNRESVLHGYALLLDCSDIDGSDKVRNFFIQSFIENTVGVLFVVTDRWLPKMHRQQMVAEVLKPERSEQTMLWKEMLGDKGLDANGQVESLVAQFNLSAKTIQQVTDEVGHLTDNIIESAHQESLPFKEDLWKMCSKHCRPQVDDLAHRIEPIAKWKDIVLPEAQLDILHEISMQVRQRKRVYDEWGFAGVSSRGLGISALFTGESGTGKTMAAEVLANDLRLDLYRIDLSQVVNKYIGETEKNLSRIFDAAEAGGAVLLFDEADALFGKRTEVKDSHDRYGNIEVSYLLQRMESYRGLAILTSNMKNALDKAFLRRIRFVVQFPFPGMAQRAAIWRKVFPESTPKGNLDWEKLARLSLPGGNIRNIAMNAAFIAADEDQPVGMPHILRAARTEYTKLDKPMNGMEI